MLRALGAVVGSFVQPSRYVVSGQRELALHTSLQVADTHGRQPLRAPGCRVHAPRFLLRRSCECRVDELHCKFGPAATDPLEGLRNHRRIVGDGGM